MHPHCLSALAVTSLVIGWLAASNAVAAQLPADDPLAKIGHIVVVFEENRSFDNMFGMFPGADGLRNAGQTTRQIDAEGRIYETLPPVMNTAVRPVAPDPRFPSSLPNAPFAIDAYVPASEATGDLVHRFYQEQVQIDGGKMDKFAVVSDAGGLVMGYYDLSGTAHWRLAKEFALGDRMFHSAFGGSMLNHTFLVCSCAFVWICERWNRDLSSAEQRRGCPFHLFIPDLVPGIPVDADHDWVTYRLADGSTWIDGAGSAQNSATAETFPWTSSPTRGLMAGTENPEKCHE